MAVEQAPEKDEPCLAYAEWLQRQGGEANCTRAEFIHLQCTKTSQVGEELLRRRREAELLPQVKRMVLGPLAEPERLVDQASQPGPVSGQRRKTHFRQGFLRNIELDAALFSLTADVIFSIRPQPSVAVTRVAQFLGAFSACPYRELVTSLPFRQHIADRGELNQGEFIRSLFGDGQWEALTTLDLRHGRVLISPKISVLSTNAEVVSFNS